MAFNPFQKINTTDDVLRRIQDAIEKCLRPIIANNSLDSQTLTNVVLKAGQVNRVPHKLGRNIQRWNPVRLRSQAVVWEDAVQTLPDKLLDLHTSADVSLDLLVS